MTSDRNNTVLRVAIAGGGTGGHIIPALAIGEGLKDAVARGSRFSEVELLFFGGEYGMERKIIPREGHRLVTLPIRGLQRALTTQNIAQNLILPFRVLASIRQANQELKKFNPHVCVGTGGYASAIPVRQSLKMRIPVVLQEQNSYPGLTTRLFASKAKAVFLTYQDAEPYLKGSKTMLTGNPVRRFGEKASREEAAEHFGLRPELSTLLIVGGSQGARALNQHFGKSIHHYLEKLNMQVLWQCGEADLKKVQVIAEGNPRITVEPFIQKMHLAYSLADLVVCRAGAMTLTELCHFGRPSILVPLPSAAGNHQVHNARSLEKADAAAVLLEEDLDEISMGNLLGSIFTSGEKLKAMGQAAKALSQPEATSTISWRILEIVTLSD